ncbi:aminoglycoside phosphotransferase family protein [Termitidicoccus mucosus]|uniref:Mucin desulfatase n=1 Tax=Termitidicoccus mucosus TaxID=1184151 RepID=A0A178IKX6_9BACT|nr:mucin desulfatase [Opitutaceae bacterium TSB47]
MPPSPATVDFTRLARGFALYGQCLGGQPYGNGHINDTYVVNFDQAGAPVRYIFQRINNRVFKNVPALMDNIRRVTAHAASQAAKLGGGDVSRRALTLIPAHDGRPCLTDEHGGFWRCYLFIEKARTYDIVETPAHAREAARAFGNFQRLLTGLPGARLHETIPDFHNTRRRYENLMRAVNADPLNRAAAVRAEIDFARQNEPLVDVLAKLHASGEIPERVTHNDTKFNNVMLDDDTHTGVCVIDLDTVMPGLALHDFGDMVRSATNSAAEDEPDLSKVSMRMPVYEGLVEGYLAAAGDFLTGAERAHLALSGRVITFEIGLRFLTDHIEGDVYFKTKRPGHNLDRARNQFALVRDIDARQSEMESVAGRLFKEPAPPAPAP